MTKLTTWGLALAVACVASACGDDSANGGNGGSGGSGGTGGTGGSGGQEGGSPPTIGGGGEGGDGGSPPGTPCEDICAFQQSLEDEIMCGYDGGSCVGDCEGAFKKTPAECVDEAIAYNDCNMAQPVEAFNCTDGVFTLTNGECTTAFDTYADCLANRL